MFKFVGGVAVGVFVGAFLLEVIGRTRPDVTPCKAIQAVEIHSVGRRLRSPR